MAERRPQVEDRRAMIAKVQIARKDLALHEESYRAILMRVTGQDSSATCTVQQLDAVLREFARLGWRAKPAKRRSNRPQIRLIHALWADLAPHLADGSDAALRAFVRRQTGVDAPEFLAGPQAAKVVEGLKAWGRRLKEAT
jgi:phage gp16-like protein